MLLESCGSARKQAQRVAFSKAPPVASLIGLDPHLGVEISVRWLDVLSRKIIECEFRIIFLLPLRVADQLQVGILVIVVLEFDLGRPEAPFACPTDDAFLIAASL